jgi:LPXTG-site transpeptidase (sortase) family protein
MTAPISGIPFDPQAKTWDAAWLSGVGWLQGTAFPTWDGRTVLTAHNVTAAGLPGPFANLDDLAYGDLIEIEADGVTYTYMVLSVRTIPAWQSWKVFEHTDQDRLSLITCAGSFSSRYGYRSRLVVEAIPYSGD